MKRIIDYDKESRAKLKDGVDALAKAVSVTLGPKGRNVVIKRGQWNGHQTTKDGVTVAKEVFFEDHIKNLGAEMVKSVAINTVNDAGDGTTTATVLAQSILEEGLNKMENGGNPVMINNGIKMGTKAVVDVLESIATPIVTEEDAINIATISANGDKELGEIIGKSMFAVGSDGSVICKKNNKSSTSWELKEGLSIDTGLISPYFVNKTSNMSCILDQPLILIYDDNILNVQDFFHLAEFARSSNRPLVVICNDMNGEALQFMITNAMEKKLECVVIKSPGFGENKKGILNDIAIATGTIVASENNGLLLPQVTPEMLGTCGRIDVNKLQTVIIGNNCSEKDISERVAEIKDQISNSIEDEEITELKNRVARLSGKIGVIRLGAKTDLEYGEKMDRVDDALSATKAGMDEGMVAGGGVALIRCIDVLKELHSTNKDEETGIQIVRNSLSTPLRRILENAGLQADEILYAVYDGVGNYGYDARNNVYVEDMIAEGIIDPVKVTRCALENASSIAGLILTTECVIIDVTNQ